MVKVGQRKFLLSCGYTDEQLDKMAVSAARNIISDIENKRKLKKAAVEKSANQNTFDSRAVFFNDVVILSREDYERLINK